MRSFASLAVAFVVSTGLGGCHSTEKVHATKEVTSASPEEPAPAPDPAPQPVHSAPCERGPIHIARAPEEAQAALLRAFHERNGRREATLDALGRHIVFAGFPLRLAEGPIGTDADREAAARAFLRRNADLFGVSAEEVDALKASVFGKPARTWTLRFESSAPLHPYGAFDLKRNLRFTLGVTGSGEVLSATNQGSLLPPFALCTEPGLAANDPKVHAGAIGQRTFFHTIAGKRVDVGPAEEKDLGPPELTIFMDHASGSGDHVVTLAYRMSFFGRGFTAFVDANTGEFLAIRQNFVT